MHQGVRGVLGRLSIQPPLSGSRRLGRVWDTVVSMGPVVEVDSLPGICRNGYRNKALGAFGSSAPLKVVFSLEVVAFVDVDVGITMVAPSAPKSVEDEEDALEGASWNGSDSGLPDGELRCR